MTLEIPILYGFLCFWDWKPWQNPGPFVESSDRGFEAGQYHAELQRGRSKSKYSRLLRGCHRLGHPLQQNHLLN